MKGKRIVLEIKEVRVISMEIDHSTVSFLSRKNMRKGKENLGSMDDKDGQIKGRVTDKEDED